MLSREYCRYIQGTFLTDTGTRTDTLKVRNALRYDTLYFDHTLALVDAEGGPTACSVVLRLQHSNSTTTITTTSR